MSETAICINCGSPKEDWNSQCHACGFCPHSSDELVESLILSLDLEAQSNEFGNENISASWSDLLLMGEKIRKREKIAFSDRDRELARLQIERFKSVTPKRVIISLFVFLFPVILLVMFLIILKL